MSSKKPHEVFLFYWCFLFFWGVFELACMYRVFNSRYNFLVFLKCHQQSQKKKKKKVMFPTPLSERSRTHGGKIPRNLSGQPGAASSHASPHPPPFLLPPTASPKAASALWHTEIKSAVFSTKLMAVALFPVREISLDC